MNTQPFDVGTERAVLGAILIDDRALSEAVEILPEPGMFRLRDHQLIYGAMLALSEAGEAIDETAVYRSLHGSVSAVTLTDLTAFGSHWLHVAGHLKAIKDAYVRQSLDTLCADVKRNLDGSAPTADVLEHTEEQLFAISESRVDRGFEPASAAIGRIHREFVARRDGDGPKMGLPSGFDSLDTLLAGFHAGDMVVLAARPSMGKTALALNVASFLSLKHAKTVGMFSLEMSRDSLLQRVLCSTARIDSQQFRRGSIHGHDQKIVDAASAITNAPLYIDDTPAISVSEMRSKSRRLKMRHGLDLLVVDYLQLCRGGSRHERRIDEVGYVSRSMKSIAKELNVPVLVLSQLSRSCESRENKRPILSDLRETGEIEQDADVVMFLYRGEMYQDKHGVPLEPPGAAELLIRKHRNGPTGNIDLAFAKHETRFFEPSWGESAAQGEGGLM